MLLIGEKLNSSVPSALAALNDDAAVISIIKAQAEADYLDVNTALGGNELQDMKRVCALVRENSGCGIMLDSPSAEEIAAVLPTLEGRVMVNSVSLAPKFEPLLPVIAQSGAGVVCMPFVRAVPAAAEERLENALKLAQKLTDAGIKKENLYFDAVVEAAAATEEPQTLLKTARLYKQNGLKALMGLSNISFGLPKRAEINCALMCAAVHIGVDAVIADITSPRLRLAYRAALLLEGGDEMCLDYIKECRRQG